MFRQALDPQSHDFPVGGRTAYVFDPEVERPDDADGVGFTGDGLPGVDLSAFDTVVLAELGLVGAGDVGVASRYVGYVDFTDREQPLNAGLRGGGTTAGTNGTGRTIYGEQPLGDGVVRLLGALLPQPTEAYYHPYGLQDDAVTYTGYPLLENVLAYSR